MLEVQVEVVGLIVMARGRRLRSPPLAIARLAFLAGTSARRTALRPFFNISTASASAPPSLPPALLIALRLTVPIGLVLASRRPLAASCLASDFASSFACAFPGDFPARAITARAALHPV
jgi:hypothetical protein